MNDKNIMGDTVQVIGNKDNKTQNSEVNLSQINDSTDSKEAPDKLAQISKLIETGDLNAFDKFVEALEDEDQYIRCIAAKGLGNLGNLKAIDPLIKSLKDKSPTVRKQSASALGKLGNIKAIQPLIDVLKDEERAVRKAAKRSISKLIDQK